MLSLLRIQFGLLGDLVVHRSITNDDPSAGALGLHCPVYLGTVSMSSVWWVAGGRLEPRACCMAP